MQVGKMDQRISIRSKVVTRDPSTGAESPTWPEGPTIWANAAPIGGREYAELAQTESEAEVRFTCHWEDVKNVTPDARVVWRGVSYDLSRPVMDIDARRRYGELLCKSTANG